MFKDNEFVNKLKSKSPKIKIIALGALAGAILATTIVSNSIGNNVFVGLQTVISKYSSYVVDIDVEKKFKDFQIDNFNVSFLESKSTKRTYTTMFTSSFNDDEVLIKEVGSYLDIFNDSIRISKDGQEDRNLLSSLSIVTKLGLSEQVDLKLPNNLKKIISVDVDGNNTPAITYLDENNVIHFDSISRHGILEDAKSIYLTEKQYNELKTEEKSSYHQVSNKEGIEYNGRVLSRFDGEIQKFVLPSDFNEIISISKGGLSKIITYKSVDGSLKISMLNDLNLSTEYKLVDKKEVNFYNNKTEKSRNVNIHIVNSLTDNNKTSAHILKTDINKDEVKKILNVDYKGGSFVVTFEDIKGKVITQDVGMTFGVLEGKMVINGINGGKGLTNNEINIQSSL